MSDKLSYEELEEESLLLQEAILELAGGIKYAVQYLEQHEEASELAKSLDKYIRDILDNN